MYWFIKNNEFRVGLAQAKIPVFEKQNGSFIVDNYGLIKR